MNSSWMGFYLKPKMSFVVFSLICFTLIACSGAVACDSCGRECANACGTKYFRTCCFNYLRKRSPARADINNANGLNDLDYLGSIYPQKLGSNAFRIDQDLDGIIRHVPDFVEIPASKKRQNNNVDYP